MIHTARTNNDGVVEFTIQKTMTSVIDSHHGLRKLQHLWYKSHLKLASVSLIPENNFHLRYNTPLSHTFFITGPLQ